MTGDHEHDDHDHDVTQHDPEAAERNKVPYYGKRMYADVFEHWLERVP